MLNGVFMQKYDKFLYDLKKIIVQALCVKSALCWSICNAVPMVTTFGVAFVRSISSRE